MWARLMLHSGRSTASTEGGAPPGSGETWLKADLFFLRDALRRGLSFAEVASFLCRSEDEVREKAKEYD
jgi:hypothetical protein